MSCQIDKDLADAVGTDAALWQSLHGASVLMTGGTGFLGKWLTATLLRANDTFNLGLKLTLLTRDPQKFRTDAPQLAMHPAVRLLRGDAATFCPQQAGAFTHIICGATEAAPARRQSDANRKGGNPNAANDACAAAQTVADATDAVRRLLDYCTGNGVKCFGYLSSGAVYAPVVSLTGGGDAATEIQPHDSGEADALFLSENPSNAATAIRPASGFAEGDALAPATLYGKIKLAAEALCVQAAATHPQLRTVILRPFAFVGPFQPLDSGYAVTDFIAAARAGLPLRIAGNPLTTRSYLYAGDFARWAWTVLLRAGSGEAVNIGSPHACTMIELAQTVRTVFNPDCAIEVAEGASAKPASVYFPDCTHVQTRYGLKAQVNLEQALRRTRTALDEASLGRGWVCPAEPHPRGSG